MGSLQLQDFAAGWVGGAASVVVGHPLDTIKTRLQAGQGYGNTLNCVLTVYRNESVAGFFKGMSFPLASIAVYSSVVFGVFSNTQRLLSQLRHGDPSRTPALADVALASMVAGFISVGIGTPVDLVKIRLQMQMQPYIKGRKQANIKLKPTVPGFPVYRGPIHCFRTVLQKEGIAGIYRGAGAMLLRDVPGYCLYFIPYTYFCGWITPDGCISPNPSSIWLAGGIAGAISWGTATPMDVVKSRLQADGVYLNKYKGTLDCILQSYQNEGLKDTDLLLRQCGGRSDLPSVPRSPAPCTLQCEKPTSDHRCSQSPTFLRTVSREIVLILQPDRPAEGSSFWRRSLRHNRI
ncbi:solute carrier family 25 member 48 isoform X3 [Grus americana]|uniref:solute carrier family 25 member 48 isoform X3 n=1 Tax=Grus americana TaxID=9117 RepID=UPI00240801AA|nr:solute carrier family 25 member 48 isoform X3 [Grus americana]